MAFAKINKSGCCERHGNVQVRVDFYLDPADPRYQDTYVQVIDETSKEYQKGYPEDSKITEQEWIESLPKKWQTTPFHSHFMYFSPDVTEAEILKEAECHLPNFYTAFQNQWDKSDGGMRHGWATEKRIRPIRKDETLKASDYEAVRLSCEAKVSSLSELTTRIDILEGKEFPATEIDIGLEAVNRADDIPDGFTVIAIDNPANDTGTIDTVEIWADTTLSGAKAGTFYGSNTTYTSRDVETIGSVSSGSKQSFSGLNIDVESGDLIGIYYSAGSIESDGSGYSGLYYKSGDQFGAGSQSYSTMSGDAMSLYGTGATPAVTPTATTLSVSNITHNSAQANGNITDAGSSTPDERGFVYGTTSKSAPGNVAPASSGYDDYENETGTYSTGTYNLSLTSLTENQTYYVRAYAHNSAGYSYGSEVSFTTAKAYNVSITTNLSLSPSVTFTKGKGVVITTGLGLCVNDRNNYLITIPPTVTRDVVDFPFVITENNIPSSFWDEAETDNLILRDVTGDLLYGELVTLDTVNHKLELYVKIPYAFEGISRSFYLYCGDGDSLVGLTGTANAQNVWDSSFVFVSHMNDNPTGDGILDSTSNGNHGTKGAAPANPTEVDGLVGKAQSFDSSNSQQITKSLFDVGSTAITLEMLFKTAVQESTQRIYQMAFLTEMPGSINAGSIIVPHSSTRNAIYYRPESGLYRYFDPYTDNTEYTDNEYHAIGFTHDQSLDEIVPVYGDGVPDGSLSAGLQSDISGNFGGLLYIGTQTYTGLIDETRISSTARDGGWIGFTSSNLKENSTSYSVTETSQTSPSRQVNYSRDSLTNLSLASIVTRTVNYAVRHIVTSLSLNPIVTRTVAYTRSATTSLSFQAIVTAIKRGWVKVKLKLFKRSVNMYMNNRNVKVKLHKRDVNLKIRRK